MSEVALNQNAIVISGEPRVLLCASLFYFRLPRECWEARMKQLRMAGYRCVDVYLPWNFHELRPGEWHFEGMHDAGAFLSLAAKHGLYVVARPGPYICSEWDGGALPAWLYNENIPLRQDDNRYLARLDEWLNKILPIIAANEQGKGGSVVAVQLENEMDFFGCQSPGSYMEHLKQTARACGITVPLIACAGQCDVQGACGGAAGVYPTFNAYSSDSFAHLETQLAHMRGEAASFDAPLMITETDRAHAKLKRELASGVKLISPYNQVGGTNVDMTNGISNWASSTQRPLALMATDYDFVSMITADGRLREEAGEARLMGSLIDSLGAHLGAAAPCEPPIAPECDFQTALTLDNEGRETPCYPTLQMDCGYLVGVSNVGSTAGHMRFCADDDASCSVPLKPGETRLLPWKLSLAPWGVQAVLAWSEAELCDIHIAANRVEVTLTGHAQARAKVQHDASHTIVTGEAWAQCGSSLRVRILPRQQAISDGCPGLPPLNASIPSQIETSEVTNVRAHAFSLRKHATPLSGGVQPMESAGLYRGDVFYETTTAQEGELLMHNAADFLWAVRGGECHAFYSAGESVLLPNGKGALALRAQSWGHVNFDDVRQPALKMGSAKGVSAISLIVEKRDITDLWYIYPDAKYAVQGREDLRATDRILSTTLNTWSYPASPMTADFTRMVYLRGDCDRFLLNIEEEGAQVTAYVDGKEAGSKRANDPWIDLSHVATAGCGVELRLRITRRFSHDSLGTMTLYCGQSVNDVKMLGVPVEAWRQVHASDAGEAAALPIKLGAGAETLLSGLLPAGGRKDRMLVLEGSGMEATLVAHDYVCGRVLLATPGYPEVRGGSSRRIYLPAAWQEDACLHLTGLGTGGELTAIKWETILS